MIVNKEEINFEDWFKDLETINKIPPIPKDFKGMFKNTKLIDKTLSTSEETKAIKRLKDIINDYSLNSEDLHYAIILYHLILNLRLENQQLKEKITLLKSANLI